MAPVIDVEIFPQWQIGCFHNNESPHGAAFHEFFDEFLHFNEARVELPAANTHLWIAKSAEDVKKNFGSVDFARAEQFHGGLFHAEHAGENVLHFRGCVDG